MSIKFLKIIHPMIKRPNHILRIRENVNFRIFLV